MPSYRIRVIVPVLLLVVIVAAPAWSGYMLESSWDPGSRQLTWHISVESGSPEPFRDFHVVTGDGRWAYTLISGPPGWYFNVTQSVGEIPLRHWLSAYGDSAVTEATIVVEYTGGLPVSFDHEWLLTNDGDLDPQSGVIPGEGGFEAAAPSYEGINTACKVAVHVLPHLESRTCSRDFPVIADPVDIVTTCPGNDVDFFPVFYNLTEYLGMEYSVTWPGSQSCAFSSCSDLTVGTIMYPLGTVSPWDQTDMIAHTWLECQPGPVGIPGFGWITEPIPSMICLAPSSSGGYIWVLDCTEDLPGPNEPVCNFCAGIGGMQGDSPLGPSAVEDATWGTIKSLFK
jgi:hypothetical protein